MASHVGNMINGAGANKGWQRNPLLHLFAEQKFEDDTRRRSARKLALKGKDVPDDVRPV